MADDGIMVSQTKLQQKHSTKKYKESFKKRKTITTRVSEEQHKKIKELAKTNGQSVTQYMIGRAFEHPNFDRAVAYGIRNLDSFMNNLKYQEEFIEKKWRATHGFNPEDVESLLDIIDSLRDDYSRFKSALLKTYMTDLEKTKLTEQEKKNKNNKEIERHIRLINMNEKLRGVS